MGKNPKVELTGEQQKLVDQINAESDAVVSGHPSARDYEEKLQRRFDVACEQATPKQRELMMSAVEEHWEEDQLLAIIGSYGGEEGSDDDGNRFD